MIKFHLKNHDKTKRYSLILKGDGKEHTTLVPENVQGHTHAETHGDNLCWQLFRALPALKGSCLAVLYRGNEQLGSWSFTGTSGLDNEHITLVSSDDEKWLQPVNSDLKRK